jgi:hypothetical protein
LVHGACGGRKTSSEAAKESNRSWASSSPHWWTICRNDVALVAALNPRFPGGNNLVLGTPFAFGKSHPRGKPVDSVVNDAHQRIVCAERLVFFMICEEQTREIEIVEVPGSDSLGDSMCV